MASSRRPRATRRRAAGRLARPAAHAWPVLAGAVTALGVVGSVHHYGLVGLVLMYAGSAAFGMVMMCAAHADQGLRGVPFVRVGLGAALVLVVMLGTIILFPIAGWFVVAAVALTSPPALTWLTQRRRSGDHERSRAFVVEALSSDQTLVDRSFQRIVASLEKDRAWGAEGL
jgi:hypothetical protein